MKQIVEDLIKVDGVVGSLLVGKDGLVVSSSLLEAEDAEVLGAMSAAIFAEVYKAARRIGVGRVVDTVITASEGAILMMEAEDLLLVVLTQRNVNVGLIKIEMRRAARRIQQMLSS